MPLPYNTQPCSAVDDLDNTEVLGTTQTHDVGGSSHAYEHVQAYMDEGIDIDASQDEYEEFINTDGSVDEAKVLDGTQIKQRGGLPFYSFYARMVHIKHMGQY